MASLTINDISKSYRLYKKPLDRLKEALFKKQYHQEFYSLQNISFTVSMGETVGIIGDNGAGKSTLLKILAGTLSQNSGDIHVSGRITALLELGSGFHQEFTGRQNIWMNASLMGLEKSEIEKWEDEIILFSELDEFIDRPIKTYSSGMVVRLAFSIATIVDPDILIIDEALSVGDQNFQKKCIDKMVEIKNRGKIILFCSHSLYLVNMMCDRALWLDKGKIVKMGETKLVTTSYENFCRKNSTSDRILTDSHSGEVIDGKSSDRSVKNGNAFFSTPVQIRSIYLNGVDGNIDIATGDKLVVDIVYESHQDIEYYIAAVLKRNDQLMCHATKMSNTIQKPLRGKGVGKVSLVYPAIPFYHGEFILEVLVADNLEILLFDRVESGVIKVMPGVNICNEMGLLKVDHGWMVV